MYLCGVCAHFGGYRCMFTYVGCRAHVPLVNKAGLLRLLEHLKWEVSSAFASVQHCVCYSLLSTLYPPEARLASTTAWDHPRKDLEN